MSSDDDQQVPRAADNGSGDEVDGNEPERKPEGQGDRPARPRQQRRSQEERRNEDNRPPQEEPWDPDPNHPGNLNIAGIAAESGRIVFIPNTKKTPNDKHKNHRNDRH